MKRASYAIAAVAGFAVAAVGFSSGAGAADKAAGLSAEKLKEITGKIDDAALKTGAPGNWLTYNGSPSEQRFSTLDQITDKNVGEMKLVWSFPTGTNRGLEATPLVVDGVMYTTANWSVVHALDAKTGKELWSYDPKVPKEHGHDACCDVVNRGVALYKGKVFVGTIDARLLAIDAATGKLAWEVATADKGTVYTITGAPRIANGKVLIGNGGAEYGVRGYVSAYDTETGKLVWRVFTVPGDPSKPQESKALEDAAKTWKGADEWLKRGAGGTAWDSLTYDPELNQVYFGTGNGTAWVQEMRSPGGGDNLFLSSILAVDADSGEVKWHYQVVPGDNWDFDACAQITLATLKIDGKDRKVLMQAPKSGFFYVIDRETGKLLSAKQYADKVTWAKAIDMKTGKPIENAGQRYEKEMAIVQPSAFGAHNWHPMSFNPKTGLVYIPEQEGAGALKKDPDFKVKPGTWNIGIDLTQFKGLNRDTKGTGKLLAWDPVKQKAAWAVQHPNLWNGGTMTTAGNLVFQGTSDGRFVAYSADKGKKLWEAPVESGIIAGPMTYEIDGVQYVSVSSGWGGAFALVGGGASAASGTKPGGVVLTYALPSKVPAAMASADPAVSGDIAKGEVLYHHNCGLCHGANAISGSGVPDLRHSNPDLQKVFVQIVEKGIPGTGMAPLGKWVSEDEAKLIQKYVQKRTEDEKAGR